MNLLFLLFSQIIALPEQPDIQLEIIGQASNNPNWAFFAPHENENVVNHYVIKQIQDKGGVFVILRQHGERLIQLNIEPFAVRIDPNRIFTQAGRRKNIIKLNPKLRENTYVFHRAMRRSASLAQLILNAMGGKDSTRAWVAIHNNTQGFRGDDKQGIGDISIHLYRKKLAAGASFLAAASEPMLDEDDLFFVTEQEDYAAMQQDGWNVVLQHPQVIKKTSEDDGSLSVFAHKNGIRYINIEAERSTASFGENHFELQSKMVDYVVERLQGKLIQRATANSLTQP